MVTLARGLADRRPLPPRIGVFDSGLGGLSILSSIRAVLPSAEYVYCSDNLNFPYGTKSLDEVEKHTAESISRLSGVQDIDVLVVACNTASTVALPSLRSRFDFPIVGVVPAIKPAAKISKTKVIGLLATPGTISRQYTLDLVEEFASDCEFIFVGSDNLVRLAEGFVRGADISPKEIRAEIRQFLVRRNDLDTVILACTHFPLLALYIQKELPSVKNWVDSGNAVAQRVVSVLLSMNLKLGASSDRHGASLLGENVLGQSHRSIGQVTYYFTGNIDHDPMLVNTLQSSAIERPLKRINKVEETSVEKEVLVDNVNGSVNTNAMDPERCVTNDSGRIETIDWGGGDKAKIVILPKF